MTVAPAMKWECVSQAMVSLGQLRAVCSPWERATKYRDAWRLSKPVASTATVGFWGIRPHSDADVDGTFEQVDEDPFKQPPSA